MNQSLESFVFVYNSDGVRDTLPQHMVTWQSQYFRLKEFEKWHGQEGFSDLPLKQIIKLSLRGTLSTQEGEALISKDRGIPQGI